MLLGYVDGTAEALLIKRGEIDRSAESKGGAYGRKKAAQRIAASIEGDDGLLRALTRNAEQDGSWSNFEKEIGFGGGELDGLNELHRSGDLLGEQRCQVGGGSERRARYRGDHAAI